MLPLAHMGITVTVAEAIENRFRVRLIDHRVLLAASLLPDLIDKPLGWLLFNGSLLSSKEFGHSLLFLLLIGAWGAIWLFKGRSLMPLIIFIGTAVHDFLDVMWFHPVNFFWPIYGWSFPIPEHEAWVGVFKVAGMAVSKLALLEMIGGALLLRFVMILFFNNDLNTFFRRGKLSVSKPGSR